MLSFFLGVCMKINEAQERVALHLKQIGYSEIETSAMHAFLHLVEEIGETSRSLLYKETNRRKAFNETVPGDLEEEIADVFWQTLKLATYLEVDLESAFLKKLEKNRQKQRQLTKKSSDNKKL